MANTGEIKDLTVSWEGYAGTSVEAFIKKEFTSALNGEVGVEISSYRVEGGILPVSNVYTYQNNPITPIVVIEDRVLGGSTKLYFPIYKAEYSFEPYTEKLEYFVFEYRSGYEVETGYYYIGTEDNLPSWVDKQNVEKLPVATTTNKGLMSSTDKTKLDNIIVDISRYKTEDARLPIDNGYIYYDSSLNYGKYINLERISLAFDDEDGHIKDSRGGDNGPFYIFRNNIGQDDESFDVWDWSGEYHGHWDESGYNGPKSEIYDDDEHPIDVIGYIKEILCENLVSENKDGLMSSTDKQKLDNAASISALNEKADKTTVRENERVVAEALNDLESRKANTNDVYTKTQTDSAISEYTYNKTTTDNLLNNKVDKIAGKGLSTNDFTVIELSDYLTQGDELPTDANLIYTYHGQVVEKRMCKLDGDNDAILFITNRDLSDLEMDDLVVLAYIRSGGGDYKYKFDATYHTTYSNCPTWVKAACGVVYANSENAGLMTPSMYDDLSTLNEKADKTTVRENERVVAEALNDLESRKANTNDVYTKAQTDNLLNAKVDTTSLGGLTLVKLTQAEYDALATKDSNKLYIIVG